jgi:uncharacterized protein (DUF305 family)
MHRMSAHHRQGLVIASIAIERAQSDYLRALARLLVASQAGDIGVLEQWWRSWFSGDLHTFSSADHAGMQGMLSPEQMNAIRSAAAPDFDATFVLLMSIHHQGAVAMANDALVQASDPPLKIMAHAVRHAQLGEIKMMERVRGIQAVRASLAAMFAPATARGHPH